MNIALVAGVIALGLNAGTAAAATVSFVRIDGATPAEVRSNAQAAADGFFRGVPRIVEDFAGDATPGGVRVRVNPAAQARTAGNTFSSPVGTFAGIGGTGSGNTVTGNPEQIQIRSGNNGGRFDVLGTSGNFLDSNDTLGITWSITNRFGGNLRGMSAFITDPNDVGRRLRVSLMNGDLLVFGETITRRQQDGSVWHLTADFTNVNWTNALFTFEKNGGNDGFAVSNATLAVIPLPAAGFLLIGGVGALAGMKALRRRKAAVEA